MTGLTPDARAVLCMALVAVGLLLILIGAASL